MSDWNKRVVDEFRQNEGRVGGDYEGKPLAITFPLVALVVVVVLVVAAGALTAWLWRVAQRSWRTVRSRFG